jgi:hypothetical protein
MRSAADFQAAHDAIAMAFKRHAAVAQLNLEGADLALALNPSEDAQLQAMAVASAVAQLGWLVLDLRLPVLDLECAASALARA